MRKNFIVGILLTNFLYFLSVQNSEAQSPNTKPREKRPEISGEFQLETGEKPKDHTVTGRDDAIAYLEKLKTTVEGLAAGNVSQAENASPETLNYFTAAYLLCTGDQGACPMYLASLFEVDIINARISKVEQCPNMKGFWKKYIDNDMENRLRFMAKIGALTSTSDFNAKERPKYLRCKDTVKVEINGTMSDAEFFKPRYKDPKKLQSIVDSLNAVKDYKAKNINIFAELAAKK